MEHRNTLFFGSLFLSRLSDQIVLFLVPLVVYKITGSVAISGIAFFLETLPRFIAFPISGILCDYFSPYRILRRSQEIRFFIIPLGLCGNWLIESVYWLIAISALSGIATSFGMMARELILPQVFKTGRFEKVLSYTSLSDQLGMVIGPVIASYLLIFYDWQSSLLIAATLFITADLLILAWNRQTQPSITAQNTGDINLLNSLTTSFHHIFSLPGLFPAIILAFGINLMLGVTLATMAPIYTGLFSQSEYAYGLLQAFGALSTVVILLIVAKYKMSLTVLGSCGFLAMSLGGLITGFASNYLFYFIGFLLIIGFDKMFNVFIRALRAKVIPPKDLGKTTGFIVLLNNISQPISGLIIALYANESNIQLLILIICGFAISLGVFVFLYLLYKKDTN